MVLKALYVGLGGFCGAISRYLIDHSIQSLVGSWFPLGTLTVNVTGSFGITLLGVWILSRGSSTTGLELMILTGFLGSFTTFSTFSQESLTLVQNGRIGSFGLNIVANVGLCLLGAWLGWMVGRAL